MSAIAGSVRIGGAPPKRFGGVVDTVRILVQDVGSAAISMYSSARVIELHPYFTGGDAQATTGSESGQTGTVMVTERTGKIGGRAKIAATKYEFVHPEKFAVDDAWLLANTAALQAVAGALTRVSSGVFSQSPPDIDADSAFADAIADV